MGSGEERGGDPRFFTASTGPGGDGLPPLSPCYGRSTSGRGNIQGARDRLIRLAGRHPDWVLGFQDEVWWSRLARPAMHAWSDGGPMRLREVEAGEDDPDPKALAGYGVLRGDTGEMMPRFVVGRPVSQVTEDFLAWACERLAVEGKKALLLVRDNASWHVSRRARAWIRAHNRRAKAEGGVRIVACYLPIEAAW